MQNYIVIGGHSIEELEMNLVMAKKAIAMGVPCGIGGSSIEDVEQGMNLMRSMMGDNAPISNPNYVPPHNCGCSCDYCNCTVCGSCEDEEEDEYCPECGEPWDGCCCDYCGYVFECEDECDCAECEDEEDELPPMLQAMVDMAKAMGVPDKIIEDALRYARENDVD